MCDLANPEMGRDDREGVMQNTKVKASSGPDPSTPNDGLSETPCCCGELSFANQRIVNEIGAHRVIASILSVSRKRAHVQARGGSICDHSCT
jgi:hypothetical protein